MLIPFFLAFLSLPGLSGAILGQIPPIRTNLGEKMARYHCPDKFWENLGRPGAIRTKWQALCPDKKGLSRIRPSSGLPYPARGPALGSVNPIPDSAVAE